MEINEMFESELIKYGEVDVDCYDGQDLEIIYNTYTGEFEAID